MIIFQGGRDITNTPKVFTELAGLYYTAQYADNNLINGNGTVFIFKTGHIYDIAVVPNIKTDNITTIKDKAEYFIEAKGMWYSFPSDFRVNNTCDKLSNKDRGKFWFYIIYNIGQNKKPRLAMFDWNHFLKRRSLRRDCTYHIHKVHEDFKNGLILSCPDIFEMLDIDKKNLILNSFREGRIISNEQVSQCPLKKDNTKHIEISSLLKTTNNMDLLSERVRIELISYINNLGKDILPENQEAREYCFSSISKVENKRLSLVYLYLYKRYPRSGIWKVWIRNERPQIAYLPFVYNMPNYDDKRDYYPSFEIHSAEDLEKTKEIIKFAYDKL